jgi:hypothetical protein
MKTDAQKDVDRIFRENRRVVDEALKRGVRRAMLRHKNEGSSVVIERDGNNCMAEARRPRFLVVVPRVQSGARRHGIVGVYGNGGNVESATFRI